MAPVAFGAKEMKSLLTAYSPRHPSSLAAVGAGVHHHPVYIRRFVGVTGGEAPLVTGPGCHWSMQQEAPRTPCIDLTG